VGTDLTIRPSGALATTVAVAAPVHGAPVDAVATELPARQSVTAAASVASARVAADSRDPQLSRKLVLDPAAASIVYRVIDDRTDEVVTQYPDDSTLRRRAYYRALDTLKVQQKSGSETDQQA
jgi:hypothetical protein